MKSSKFFLTVTIISILIALISALFFWAVGQENKIMTSIALAITWWVAIFFLVGYVQSTYRNLLLFLKSFTYNDSTISFNLNRNLPFRPLYEEFNRIIDQFRNLRLQKEMEHHYLENVVHHMETGLLAWNQHGKVEILNTAAQKLLGVPHFNHLESLKNHFPGLPDQLKKMTTGQRELIEIFHQNEIKALYLRSSEFHIGEKSIRLVSLQNIRPELEENEIHAWQKLIKVLVHEIVNSLSPISLVSSTLYNRIKHYDTDQWIQTGREELVEGLLAIQNRSRGLMKFVEDYQSISELPRPVKENIRVTELLSSVSSLVRGNLVPDRIEWKVKVIPESLSVKIDRKLVEQSILNIVKNSVYALTDIEQGIIQISSGKEEDQIVIEISDNGCGIPFNIQDFIFMPFFTTKKDGTGIGLTLTRQIMKLHHGNIRVYSGESRGTTVKLFFPL